MPTLRKRESAADEILRLLRQTAAAAKYCGAGRNLEILQNPHEDSVKYWVIEKAGYQNTEYAVYQLDKEYRTLSGEIATEGKSEAGSDAVIMIYLDGVLAYTSPTVSAALGAVSFELDVTGVSEIKVLCTTGSPSFNYCIVDAMLYEI